MRRRVQQILCGALIAGTVLASQPLPVFAETDTETGVDVSETDVKENSDYEIKVNEDNPDTATIVKYKGNEKELKIPEYIDGKKITVIGYPAFMKCESITSIEIPDSVEKLDCFAFAECESLTHVKLPGKTLEFDWMGMRASFVRNVEPWDDYSIVMGPFRSCPLKKVEIADGATKIDLKMFSFSGKDSESKASELNIYIPKTVTEIPEVTAEYEPLPFQPTIHGYKGSYAETWAKENNCPFVDREEEAENLNSGFDIEVNKDNPYKAVVVGYHGNEKELKIPEYIGDKRITEVASGAFKDCKNITSLEIPATVEKLNSCLFGADGSSSLVSVKLPGKNIEISEPSEVTDADGHAVKPGPFAFCENLKKVEIPEGFTKLPEYFLSGCTGLESVELPEGITRIPDYLFSGCVSLDHVQIPKTVTEIGKAFVDCKSLTEITMPDTLTGIGKAFQGCRSLQEIRFPKLLKEISMDAFADCSNLKKVVIPGVSTIVKSSKSYISGSLKLYAYKESEAEKWAKQTDPACFVDLADVEKKVEPTWEIKVNEADRSTANIVKYEGNDVVLEIPEYIDGKKITGLELGAFDGTSIQLVKIPASVKNVEYPEDYDERFSYEQWDDGPFSSCPYLTKAVIEEGAATVPDTLFADCYQLKTVVIPDTVTEIEGEAFRGCRSLENVKLPANLLCLGRFAFSGCQSLTNIKIPRSLNEAIEEEWMVPWDGSEYVGPFAGCDGLKKAELEDGIKKVPDSLFAGCKGLETVLIPASVTSIGKEAFGEYYYRCEPTIQGYADTFAEEWAKENGFKFTSLGENPVTATPAPSVANEYSAKISGRNLSLTGKIGASVYVQVSDELLKDENAYVTITVGDKEEKTLLKDLTCMETKGRKVLLLSTNVKANETNEGVCVRLYAGEGRLIPITDDNSKKADVYTYTVADTARVYMNAKSSSKKLKKLAEAILNYGIYTQKQQNYKADDLTATDDLADIKKSVLKNYAIKKSGKVNGVSYAGVNMELKEDTGITVYFKATVDPSKLTFTVDGKKLDVETKDLEKGKLVSVKINGISAQKLSTAKMVVVSDGESELKLKLSALSWCEIVLNGKNYSKETVDLAKMLYRYSSAADQYFGK